MERCMKMRMISVLCVILFALPAQGEYLPAGCYVADFYRTDPCWVAVDGVTQWRQSTDRTATTLYYGSSVESIIYNGLLCSADYSTVKAAYDSSEANRQEWITYSGYQTGLIKRLKRACGAKCKRLR